MPDSTALSVKANSPVLAFVYDRRFTPTLAILQLRLETCREYAAELGWEIAGEWVDVDADAMSDEHRPQLDAMLTAMCDAAAAGRRVVCLLNDWDRLCRDPNRQAVFRRRIGNAGGYTATQLGQDDRRMCERCRLPIEPGREGGGWAASGPGHVTHADISECGPLPLPEPLPPVRLSGGHGPWPSDHHLRQLLDREQSAQ